MASEQLMSPASGGGRYFQMQPEQFPSMVSSLFSFAPAPTQETNRIFEELPKAVIVSVSRPDAGDISPFKWQLVKKASQVFYLHFALKKRAFIEEIHEKQEQVKEWLQNLGIGDHPPVVQDEDADEVPLHQDESAKNRDVPSSAALPVIRPLGRQQSISVRGKHAMQEYLNHFLGNLDIVNSREVFGGFDVVILTRVWGVLKPGFLALLEDPFDAKLLDIIVFDVLPVSNGNDGVDISLAVELKDHNPLRHAFKVTSGNRSIRIRAKNSAKVKDWVASINDAALRPPEGWCHPHRFGSYAPPRGLTDDGSQAQWFVDGGAAFAAIAAAIENAKSEIFICGWWVCPELYLRRPFDPHTSSRLDNLLENKAKQGVQIYILIYKEVALALKINSVYSKRRLLGIHENVRVLRYPDHFSSGVYLWSHHEKLVIVDNQVCFIGGLDLCFGRYDTFEHKVGDNPSVTWPGKDYYNPRESEPNTWEDALKDELERKKHPRMPWHDVHCALWGPPCRDVARHFVQRWNYAKRNKAPYEDSIPLLMPQHHMVIPHYMGRQEESDIESKKEEDSIRGIRRDDSFSSRSSLQDIPLLLPHEPVDQDGSSGGHKENGTNNRNGPFSFRKSKIEPVDGDTPMRGFVDDRNGLDLPVAKRGSNAIDSEWWETQDHDYQVGSPDETGQVGPRTSCRCQWSAGTSQVEESIHSAYRSLIDKAEHFIYIENQFFISGLSGDDTVKNRVLEALYKRILRAHNEKKIFRVVVVIPLLPGFQGGIDDSGAASVRAIMHWQYRTIYRGHNSILTNLYNTIGVKAHDYISFYGLRAYGKLSEDGPVATSQVYVHSKIMIVDDRAALIGSANINDRSLLGSRDSEIGVLIEDTELVDSRMAGKPWKAGKFSSSLRLSLWSEHLGLRTGEIDQIIDPVSDSTYKEIWMATAKTNTMIYQDVFSCVPNDLIHSRMAFRQSLSYWKEKLGHTTIDLGIAPEKLESYHNGDIKRSDPMDRLKAIKGHLVSFPLDFMCKEDLRPVFNESEYYASPQVFH
ncbi:unnamed protein product [Arabidopsis thaliana]|uniref:Phospholipase n=1 Tax=Arabidopsis thaliana TaxID=3702 RepID=A0A654F7V5_ARATH|nr:unnamed protein product [Arabidopsis thaliana]